MLRVGLLSVLILLYTNYGVESSPVIGAFDEDEPDEAWEKLDTLIKTSSEFEGDWQSEVSIVPSFKSGTEQTIPWFPQQEQQVLIFPPKPPETVPVVPQQTQQVIVAPPKPQETVPVVPQQTQQHLLWGALKPQESVPAVPQQTQQFIVAPPKPKETVPVVPQQTQQVIVAPPEPQETVPVVPQQTQQHLLWGNLKPEETVPMIPQQKEPTIPLVPQPLNLPQFTVVKSPMSSGVFEPSGDTRPLPEGVKPIFLPPAPTYAPPPQYNGAVDALCHLDRMYVRIKKELFYKPDDAWRNLKIGTCPVNEASKDHYYFLYYLRGCGLKYEDKGSYSTFSNTLTYNPPATGQILRELPFSVNVLCKYHKHFYAYARGFHPELKSGTVFARLDSPSQFTLKPYDDKWGPIMPGHSFTIGKPMHFEAKVPASKGAGRTYIKQCFITPTSDPNVNPKYTVIENNGCMVDSKESSSSKFIAYSVKTTLRFSIGAFVFRDSAALPTGQRLLYLHCEIIEGPVTPSPSLKSCTYDRATKKWVELYDNTASVCSCCETTCPSTVPTGKMVSSDPWKLPENAKESVARIDKAADVPDLIEADLHDGFETYWSS